MGAIKNLNLISNYIGSLDHYSKKLFANQLINYFGTGFCRRKRHLTLDNPDDPLADQLWDHRVKLKRIQSHSLFKNTEFPNNKSNHDLTDSAAFHSQNGPYIVDKIPEISEGFANESSSNIVADLFNSIVGMDIELGNMLNDANKFPQELEIKDNHNDHQSITIPGFKYLKDAQDYNQNILKSESNQDLLSISKKKILNYLSRRFVVRPTIPNYLPPPISKNLLLFQDLVKNSKGPPISVVNIIDDTPPPLDFEFINESRYASDVPRPQQLQVNSCSCETEELTSISQPKIDGSVSEAVGGSQIKIKNSSSIFSGYSQEQYNTIVKLGCKHSLAKNGEITSGCVHNPETGGPYNSSGLLQLPEKHAIYECNWMCSCGPFCLNRLIQRGPTISFQIFKTAKKGWGVRTLETLQKGQFVAEYVGEVITYAEAERRGKKNDKLGSTYLFDLDFETLEDMDPEFTIDAEKCGNVAHFLNHSCDPNLQIRAAYINHCDSRLHQLAFFTKSRIPAGTELTFDYNPSSPFPGDRGYIDFSEHKGRNLEFSSFRSPNRSSRPGLNASSTAPSGNQGAGQSSNLTMDPQTEPMSPGYMSDGDQAVPGPIATPKKQPSSVAPFIHKGYVCYCGAVRCRGFVFLS
ncbi:Histone-lysine N-methyltransferase SUV39H2 [Smittium mucronatum]|uniref:Histone-lysine N-methyltransferase SUV39H2 n=1 Tax=Smittium mucronatum TaxID=133383 RepID=A0A1R0H0S0_9FUNG|nr:Histone-lysine N-methyltransferase SUV39H2 [Smittium mucronatum]